jgi:hypothetical protein
MAAAARKITWRPHSSPDHCTDPTSDDLHLTGARCHLTVAVCWLSIARSSFTSKTDDFQWFWTDERYPDRLFSGNCLEGSCQAPFNRSMKRFWACATLGATLLVGISGRADTITLSVAPVGTYTTTNSKSFTVPTNVVAQVVSA